MTNMWPGMTLKKGKQKKKKSQSSRSNNLMLNDEIEFKKKHIKNRVNSTNLWPVIWDKVKKINFFKKPRKKDQS